MKAKQFSKINIEISNICNLQCSFCPEVIRAKQFMELGLFRRVIEQVAPLTEQVCFHLMGDPLVHPNLAEFVTICEEFGVRVFLVTNGVLLREKQAEILLRPAIRQVCFSLHSFGDNYPERDPDPYLNRIFEFTERAFRERPDLYLNYRLWNLTELRGDDPKNQVMLQKIYERFAVAPRTFQGAPIRKSHRLMNRLYLHFDTEFVWPDLALPVLGEVGRCHGLSTHFGILADGTVVPCCLDKEGRIALGNVSERPILEILDSPKAQAILSGFKSRKLVDALCQRCQYIERFRTSPSLERRSF
jgi:radical SAM protein with 4Fe4S-binding SPASM domain